MNRLKWCWITALLLCSVSIWFSIANSSTVALEQHQLVQSRKNSNQLLLSTSPAVKDGTNRTLRMTSAPIMFEKVPVSQFVEKCLTPIDVLGRMEQVLRDVTEILDSLGVGYWLDQGTLLGALRFGSHLPFDDDADVGVLDIEFTESVEARFMQAVLKMGYLYNSPHNPRKGQPKRKKNAGGMVQIFFKSFKSAGHDVVLPDLHLDVWVYQFDSFVRNGSHVPVVQYASNWHARYMRGSPEYRSLEGIPLVLLYGPTSSISAATNRSLARMTIKNERAVDFPSIFALKSLELNGRR